MLTLTQRLPANSPANSTVPISAVLYLTAEERTQSRLRIEVAEGEILLLCLPRGTILQDGDLLQSDTSNSAVPPYRVRVLAKAEPVMTVKAATNLDLLRAAYHLGNRHVPLEITATYLRFAADPVLKSMLEHLGLQVEEELQPFQPETGAYGHHHG